MSDDMNDRTFDRRSILGALGTASGGLAMGSLGSDLTVAAKQDANRAALDRAMNQEKVEEIIREFGGLSANPRQAKRVELADEEYEYDVVQTPTTVGELTYIERDDGVDEAALLLSPGEEPKPGAHAQLRSNLPRKYRDVPLQTTVSYVVGEGGSGLFRALTDTERRGVGKAVGADPESTFAWAFDKVPGFQVLVDGDDAMEGYQVVPAGTKPEGPRPTNELPDQMQATASSREIVGGQVNTFEDAVGTQGWDLVKCLGVCKTCLASAYTCFRCAGFCAAGVTGIGIIACAVCLVMSCGAAAGSCYLCYDNCKHHVPYVG